MSIGSASASFKTRGTRLRRSYCLFCCGLSTSCLSLDADLVARRTPPPELRDGRIEGGAQPCLGTLARRDKVFTLGECVGELAPERLSFIEASGRRHAIATVSRDPARALDDFSDEGRAILTLAEPVEDATPWHTGWVEPGFKPVWVNTLVKGNDARRWLFCELHERSDDALDCGSVERWSGGAVLVPRGDEPMAIGIDRGRGNAMLRLSQVDEVPDRITDVALYVGVEFQRPELQLHVTDPDWNRITSGRLGWQVAHQVDFSPVSLSFFERDDAWWCIAADAHGDVHLENARWENLEAPEPIIRVRTVDTGAVVALWGLGRDGALCRKQLAPEREGWRCGASIPEAVDVSVLSLDGREWVAASSRRGVWALSFEDDAFGAPMAWGLDDEVGTAITLGQLQDRTAYALAATEGGALWLRTADADGAWAPFRRFSAGPLPERVVALQGGHVAGWPEEIYAVSAGRLHHTIQLTETGSSPDAGTASTGHDFASWR